MILWFIFLDLQVPRPTRSLQAKNNPLIDKIQTSTYETPYAIVHKIRHCVGSSNCPHAAINWTGGLLIKIYNRINVDRTGKKPAQSAGHLSCTQVRARKVRCRRCSYWTPWVDSVFKTCSSMVSSRRSVAQSDQTVADQSDKTDTHWKALLFITL